MMAPLIAACGSSASQPSHQTPATAEGAAASQLRDLEQQHHARLGVYAVDTVTGKTIAYRADERFAMDSTFKGLACGALLREHPLSTGYFDQVIHYTEDDVLQYAPITSKHVDTGMTVSQLCDAAITLSDNTAGNLVLKQLGGPEGWTTSIRALGDPVSRLDRWETALNTSIPGDQRDTTTPSAETADYRALILGPALQEPERTQLTTWLAGNKTGDKRIRAALPAGWKVADKTGTGDYGSANDVGVIWPPDGGHPIALTILTTHDTSDAKSDEDLIAAAARIAIAALH